MLVWGTPCILESEECCQGGREVPACVCMGVAGWWKKNPVESFCRDSSNFPILTEELTWLTYVKDLEPNSASTSGTTTTMFSMYCVYVCSL